MVDTKALRCAMINRECSARELALVIGISPSALYRRFNGTVDFTLGEVLKCVARLKLTSQERDRIFFAGQVS